MIHTTAGREDAVRQALLDGARTSRELGRAAGISHQGALNILERLGLELPPPVATTTRRRRGRGTRPPLYGEEMRSAFEARVDKSGPLIPGHPELGPCWTWTGPLDKRSGYAMFSVKGWSKRAHRWSYRAHCGPIPLPVLDHLCHSWAVPGCEGGPTCPHRRCVSPRHLDPTTTFENNRRAKRPAAAHSPQPRTMHDACANGHLWTNLTTLYDVAGRRVCADCIAGFY